ncbi:MAG TPA: HD domain-containing phosphohydrolase, partial [Acidimicrobiales bacterium]|nr:HD domain-containing phosphohydrolase [Acidimicrobiales bacterium]
MVRIAVFAVPIGLSVFVTAGLSRLIPRPAGIWPSVVWWGLIATGGTAVLYTADLLIRRLLPLAALFKLTLVFPDRAPTRFGVALRTGTSRQLARRLADAGEHGLGDTPQEAAETLLVLVAALSVHDRLTRGHCERVRAYTDLIAKELGLGPEDTSKIHWAAMIHDIGKLEVPAEILSKPTHLTDEEFEIIKIHPEAGARLAAPL